MRGSRDGASSQTREVAGRARRVCTEAAGGLSPGECSAFIRGKRGERWSRAVNGGSGGGGDETA